MFKKQKKKKKKNFELRLHHPDDILQFTTAREGLMVSVTKQFIFHLAP